jgi:hypothetical protein
MINLCAVVVRNVVLYSRYLSSVECTRDSKRSLLNGIHSLSSHVVYAVAGQLAVAVKIFVTREILCPTDLRTVLLPLEELMRHGGQD